MTGCIYINEHFQDRVHAPSAGVPELEEKGLSIFIERIIRSPIKEHLVSTILAQIKHERDDYAVNRSTIRSCVDFCVKLVVDKANTTVYKRDIEPAILADSRKFYEIEGDHLASTCSAPEFLKRVGGFSAALTPCSPVK
jgi:cullin 3